VRCTALKIAIVLVSATSSAIIFLFIMKTTRQLIEAARQLEADRNEVAERIISVLAKDEGKKLTRRILPKIAAAIGQEVYMSSPCDSLLYVSRLKPIYAIGKEGGYQVE
jgi:hypothetical protein